MIDHLEILAILTPAALAFGVFVGLLVAWVPAKWRPLAVALLGNMILMASFSLSMLIMRDAHAYEQTKYTAHPQGLEWAGIDGWGYFAGYVIGGAFLAIAAVWWTARKWRSRRTLLAPVTPLPEQSLAAS